MESDLPTLVTLYLKIQAYDRSTPVLSDLFETIAALVTQPLFDVASEERVLDAVREVAHLLGHPFSHYEAYVRGEIPED